MPKKNFLKWLLDGCSVWGIGIFANPILELEAVSKPLDATQRGDWFKEQPPLYNSAITTIPSMHWDYIENSLGIYVDDSKLEVNQTMCDAIRRSMEPMKEGG